MRSSCGLNKKANWGGHAAWWMAAKGVRSRALMRCIEAELLATSTLRCGPVAVAAAGMLDERLLVLSAPNSHVAISTGLNANDISHILIIPTMHHDQTNKVHQYLHILRRLQHHIPGALATSEVLVVNSPESSESPAVCTTQTLV